MLGAVLRVPAPIPLLPAPARRPLLLLPRRRPPSPAPMASHTGAKNPDASAPPAPAPQPPEKPLPGDCCGSGCVRCVWDVYYDELDAYNKALAARATSHPSDEPPADGDSKAKS